MALENDEWKNKYQSALRELDQKEQEWSGSRTFAQGYQPPEYCRRGLTKTRRTTQTDSNLFREKRDDSLEEALNQLSSIISSLDQPPTPNQYPESMLLLMETLQEINLDKDQQQRLKPLCAELLKMVAAQPKGNPGQPAGQRTNQTNFCLVNENLAGKNRSQLAHSLVAQLVGLLNLDSRNQRLKSNAILEQNRELQQTELHALANTMNTFFKRNPAARFRSTSLLPSC